MSNLITLEALDQDSAIREAAEAAISNSHRSKKNDIKILNDALTLEYLESTFYNQAGTSGALTQPEIKVFASVVRNHENAHVVFLKKALGSKVVKKPKFDSASAARTSRRRRRSTRHSARRPC